MTRKSILAATDLSARSDRAIDRALQLGRDWGIPVEVIHVRDPDASYGVDQDFIRDAVRAVLPDLQTDCTVLVETGAAPQIIAQVAEEHEAALIVTGVARFNSLGDYFLGTAVDKIVRHAKTPVLIVKHRPHRTYQRLLCAVDFSPHSGKALCAALRLFPNAEVLALHAYHVAFEAWNKDAYVREGVEAEVERNFETFLAELPLSDGERQRLTYRTGYGDIGSVLRKELDSGAVDLVVLGTHGMGGIRQATIGSIASSLLEWVATDTLIVPPG